MVGKKVRSSKKRGGIKFKSKSLFVIAIMLLVALISCASVLVTNSIDKSDAAAQSSPLAAINAYCLVLNKLPVKDQAKELSAMAYVLDVFLRTTYPKKQPPKPWVDAFFVVKNQNAKIANSGALSPYVTSLKGYCNGNKTEANKLLGYLTGLGQIGSGLGRIMPLPVPGGIDSIGGTAGVAYSVASGSSALSTGIGIVNPFQNYCDSTRGYLAYLLYMANSIEDEIDAGEDGAYAGYNFLHIQLLEATAAYYRQLAKALQTCVDAWVSKGICDISGLSTGQPTGGYEPPVPTPPRPGVPPRADNGTTPPLN